MPYDVSWKKVEVPISYTTDINITVEQKFDEDGKMLLDKSNLCKRRGIYPQCFIFQYNNIDIECQICILESGGIIAKILVSIVKILDDLSILCPI